MRPGEHVWWQAEEAIRMHGTAEIAAEQSPWSQAATPRGPRLKGKPTRLYTAELGILWSRCPHWHLYRSPHVTAAHAVMRQVMAIDAGTEPPQDWTPAGAALATVAQRLTGSMRWDAEAQQVAEMTHA